MAKVIDKYKIQAEKAGEIIDLKLLAQDDSLTMADLFDDLKISELQRKVDLFEKEKEKIKLEQENHFKEIISGLKNEINNFEQEKAKIKLEQENNFKDQLNELQNKIDAFEQEKTQIKLELENNFKENIANLKNEIKNFEQEKAKIKLEQENNFKDQLNELQNKIDAFEQEKVNIKLEQENNFKDKLNILQNKIDSFEKEKANLILEEQTKFNDEKILLEKENSKVVAEKESLKEKLELQFNNKISEMEQKIASYEENMALQKELATKNGAELKEAELNEKIEKLREERDTLKFAKQVKNIKLLGNELEKKIFEDLQPMFELVESTVKHVKAGQSGADINIDIIENELRIGGILIECKTFEEGSEMKFSDTWVRKIMDDANKTDSKYKIITTYATKSMADENVPFWIEDRQNNIFVVRPEYVKWFVSMLEIIIKKEASFKDLDNNDELYDRFENLSKLIENGIPALEKQINERYERIEKYANTISNNAEKIRDEARKTVKKDLKNFLENLKQI